MIERVQGLKEFSQDIPFPLYCTRVFNGTFVFANPAFAAFLGYEEATFDDPAYKASSLYVTSAERDAWISLLYNNRSTPVATFPEFFLGERRPNKNRHSVRVLDVACLIEVGKEVLAVGILGDLHDQWVEWELAVNELQAYRAILNMIDVGVHQVDVDGRIIFMNDAERTLLGVDRNWLDASPHVCHLSADEHEVKRERVRNKILHGGKHLTLGEHRLFMKPSTVSVSAAGSAIETVPVRIHDIPVPEPDRSLLRTNHKLFTVVVDARVPEDITALFAEYGPRNPLLDEMEIGTFVKVQRQFAHIENPEIPESELSADPGSATELVFTYGNKYFVDELIRQTDRSPQIGVASLEDIYGRREAELWPVHAAKYFIADTVVMNEWRNDERIEKHPTRTGRGDTDVQVLKLPLILPGCNDGKPIGVEGFYWEVGNSGLKAKQDEIRRAWAELYRPWQILSNIPVPVFMKDLKARYVYANQAFIQDLADRSGALLRPVTTLRAIIGLKAREIFPEDLALEYERDDSDILLENAPSRESVLSYGGRLVKCIKTPIHYRRRVVGVQGIFWYVHEQPPSKVWIDWRASRPVIRALDKDKEKEMEISRTIPWYLIDLLLQHEGCPVTHAEIRAAGRIMGAGTKKNTLQQHRAKALKELNNALTSLDVGLKAEITGKGLRSAYKLTLSKA